MLITDSVSSDCSGLSKRSQQSRTTPLEIRQTRPRLVLLALLSVCFSTELNCQVGPVLDIVGIEDILGIEDIVGIDRVSRVSLSLAPAESSG